MKTQYKNYLLILLPALLMSFTLRAQTSYVLISDADFTVAGTSSLHDWTMTSKTAEGEALISMEGKTLTGIQKLSITIEAESLKSEKSSMDDNAYESLKTKKYPEITFILKQIKSIEMKEDYYLVDAEGVLTIAGESRTIAVQAKAYPNGSNLKFTGSKKIKMTDYKVDPPTALFGTIRTGDELTINFNLTFKSKQS